MRSSPDIVINVALSLPCGAYFAMSAVLLCFFAVGDQSVRKITIIMLHCSDASTLLLPSLLLPSLALCQACTSRTLSVDLRSVSVRAVGSEGVARRLAFGGVVQ